MSSRLHNFEFISLARFGNFSEGNYYVQIIDVGVKFITICSPKGVNIFSIITATVLITKIYIVYFCVQRKISSCSLQIRHQKWCGLGKGLLLVFAVCRELAEFVKKSVFLINI